MSFKIVSASTSDSFIGIRERLLEGAVALYQRDRLDTPGQEVLRHHDMVPHDDKDQRPASIQVVRVDAHGAEAAAAIHRAEHRRVPGFVEGRIQRVVDAAKGGSHIRRRNER